MWYFGRISRPVSFLCLEHTSEIYWKENLPMIKYLYLLEAWGKHWTHQLYTEMDTKM